jgi:hypothetical protein
MKSLDDIKTRLYDKRRFRDKRIKFRFDPQPDINPYVLAVFVSALINPIHFKRYQELPKSMHRHFRHIKNA